MSDAAVDAEVEGNIPQSEKPLRRNWPVAALWGVLFLISASNAFYELAITDDSTNWLQLVFSSVLAAIFLRSALKNARIARPH